MYLHLGNNKSIRTGEILGIFDMDTATVSPHTKRFLKSREKSGKTKLISMELPKSFILTEKGEVYLSQISTATLLSRTENPEL